jgi:hypothetical protein
MDKRSSKKRTTEDVNEAAFRVVQEATREDAEGKDEPPPPEPKKREKNPAAVELGKLGGKKGGPARAKKLSKERRVEIARRAAVTRWERQKGDESGS